jgi:hypothetical protein
VVSDAALPEFHMAERSAAGGKAMEQPARPPAVAVRTISLAPRDI